ncbi:hypothetical protein BBJ28_00004966 [Nothophytophthora sp. Chile5]|nr:hypothetical protein BBJ28_00004966 [Nothophytophthora sp. Chile5]
MNGDSLPLSSAETQALPVAPPSFTRRYGSMSSLDSELHQQLAAQAAHVASLHSLQQQQTRATFVPVVCSILGVVVFMRLGTVVGSLGLWYAGGAISAAFLLTFLTVGSLSALASTSDDADGGLFASLRHSLGHRLGHLIGVMMCASFGVGAAFYLLGFSELVLFSLGVRAAYPLPWDPEASWITVAFSSLLLAVLTLVDAAGVRISLRALRVVFVMVMVAIACNVLFLVVPNAARKTGLSMDHFRQNAVDREPEHFRQMFATFFPGFCGVLAGANLAEHVAAGASAGVTRRASQYFLLEVHKALAFSFVVYLLLGCVLAACVTNHVLQNEPFVVSIVVDAVLGVPVILLGVSFTTLSSALSNIKGASTLFTALYAQSTSPATIVDDAADLQTFGPTPPVEGVAASGRREDASADPKLSVFALLCTWLLCQTAILCGTVDAIIPIVSPIFLLTFFLLNFACFFEELSSTTFRPSQDAVDEQILADEVAASLGSLTPSPPHRRDAKEAIESKLIELAALYVRDAVHGRFLGEEYLIDGLSRTHYKRLFHGLRYVRNANMCVLLTLTFFEKPAWCFFLPSCGDRTKVLTWDLPVLPKHASIAIELVCLALLALELSMKYKYMGPRMYFVDKWHILQIVFLLADFVAVFTMVIVPQDPVQQFAHAANSSSSDLDSNGSKPLVLAPLIRPLILITMSHRLRSGFSSLLKALPRFVDGLMTLAFLIVIYAVLGMVLFEGTAEVDTYFKTFGDACMSLIILLTTANFPDVMMPVYSQARWSSLFFISFLTIGQLLVMNLVFASVYQHYRQEIAERALDYSTKRKLALQAAFHLLPANPVAIREKTPATSGTESKTISRTTYERLVNELMRPTISLFHDDSTSPRAEGSLKSAETWNDDLEENWIAYDEFVVLIKAFIARQKKPAQRVRAPRQPSRYTLVNWVQRFVTRGRFDKMVDLIILGNLVAILVEIQAKIHDEKSVYLTWERWMPAFSIAYLLEMLLKMYAFRMGGYFDSAKNIYDCVVTLVIFVAEVSVHLHNTEHEWEWIRLLLLLRFLRCLRLLVALHALSSMFAIVVHLIPAFTTLYGLSSAAYDTPAILLMRANCSCLLLIGFALGMLAVVMCEYAAAGTQLFGGKLVVGDPRLAAITYGQANYYSNNFNDFASSLTTLFELLIVNNVSVTGPAEWTVNRIYFVSFYVIGVVMVLSLVVAFVVEAYFEDTAGLDSSADSPRLNRPESTSAEDMTDSWDRERGNSSERTQRLLKSRSLGFEMRPRSDSIYVEEFL